MKFLHLGDLHIGKVVNGFNLIADQRHALNELLKRAIRENVDAIVISGDVYDKRNPSVEAIELVGNFLTSMAEANIASLIIPGNHDNAQYIAFGARIFAKSRIYLAERYNGTPQSVTLSDEFGPVTFWLVPFMRPAEVRHAHPNADIGTDYTAALRTVIEAASPNFNERNVMLAHQFVSFNTYRPQLSDSEVNLGGLDEVDGSVFDGFDYVALGHIHKSQAVGRNTMRYAGSLLKYSFSEALYTKEFPLVTLKEKGIVELDSITFEPLHDLREIAGPFEELISPEIVQRERADDYLHITLTDPHPILDALQKIRAVYPNVMTLDYESDIKRARTSSVQPTAAVAFTSALELFETFFEQQTGEKLTDNQHRWAQDALERMIEQNAQGLFNQQQEGDDK